MSSAQQSHGPASEVTRVVERLRDEIIEGVRAPGERLVEREVAAALGVSRVPVREALRTLVVEGLVTPRPRSWAVVREFTASDVADLQEVRAALEPMTFRLAAQRRTRAGLERLQAVLAQELAAAQAGDHVRARRLGVEFHEVVTALAANDLLSELERTMRSRMRWLLTQHDDPLVVAEQHRELFDAIADRDLGRVDRLVTTHVLPGGASASGTS